MFQFALFDFDGVIADTEGRNSQYLADALAAFGVVLSPEEQHSLIGINDPHRIERFLSRAERRITMEEYSWQRLKMGNTYENTPLSPMPGLVPFLHYLREAEIRTAVVSSTSSHLITTALDRMGISALFDVVICGDMVAHRKPDPEPYRVAMQRLNARPEKCVIFEDSPIGIQSGKAAGAFVVGYTGSCLQQDVTQADCTLKSFETLLSGIRGYTPPAADTQSEANMPT